ncbi:unnamed protein product [Symbiodinium sp. CCMP2592]|nr:unnamed protein product [Symbiodinium sp. CCMP2592]CAE7314207.1 unnamed protein product [Symbiodinium sp. CCMP2592]
MASCRLLSGKARRHALIGWWAKGSRGLKATWCVPTCWPAIVAGRKSSGKSHRRGEEASTLNSSRYPIMPPHRPAQDAGAASTGCATCARATARERAEDFAEGRPVLANDGGARVLC